jgi:Tfp pilus assembly protein PilV
MKTKRFSLSRARGKRSGVTLAETVIAMAIAAVTIGATITGYILSANMAEWSAYSLAAQSLAMQRLEQSRAAKWEPLANPPTDELLPGNFPVSTAMLDIPISGTNVTYATITTTISNISTNPSVKMIRVSCVWRFTNRGLFTNTVMSYRAPDQ